MVWWKWVLVLGALVGSLAGGYGLMLWTQSSKLSSAVEVDWRLLGELDYITGIASVDLKSAAENLVRIPGFMVPLEDEQKSVTEFLLVPTPQACIHVPPPPSNQMVFVRMSAKEHQKVVFGPIWVYGKLELKSHQHMYGEASFQMEAVQIERYR